MVNTNRRVRLALALLAIATIAGTVVSVSPAAAGSVRCSPGFHYDSDQFRCVPDPPRGGIDFVEQRVDSLRFVGWARDATSTPVDVYVLTDGQDVATTTANRAHATGPYGFDAFAPKPTSIGDHSICIYLYYDWGPWPGLGCRTYSVTVNPFGSLEVAMQTSPTGVRVSGWAIDPDTSMPIDVHIHVDGAYAGGEYANRYRPDIESQFPHYTGHHGFDLVVPATNGTQNICAYGINVGPGVDARLGCLAMDRIVDFEIDSISYDLARAQVTPTAVDTVYTSTVINSTSSQQTSEISGSTTVSETSGWSDTWTGKVGVSTSFEVKVPMVGDGKVTMSFDLTKSYVWNGSRARSTTWSWKQPVNVAPNSGVKVTVALARSGVTVPYTLTGRYVLQSGTKIAGILAGTYTGVNSHDMIVRFENSTLAQPAPTISRTSTFD